MNQTDTNTPNAANVSGQDGFLAFISRHFDSVFYRQAYPDLANGNAEPLQHWLNFGIKEGRQVSRSVVVRHGATAKRSSGRIWQHYRWRGEEIAVRLIAPIPADVLSQIVNQARYDRAVLAAGADTVAQLSQQDRENVHLDVPGLQQALPRRADALLVIPDLGEGSAQTFSANLARVLSGPAQQSVQAIVTDRESRPSAGVSAEPEPWRSINVVFWRDFWIHGPERVNTSQLAQLVSVLRPRMTIVAQSRRGYEMVARYGRALSQRTKLYCVCTADIENNSPDSQLILQALPFATTLTDDIGLAERLRQYGDRPGRDVVALPNHSATAFRDAVTTVFRPS